MKVPTQTPSYEVPKTLFNGCSRSKISVTPKKWDKAAVSVKKACKIHFRFYDPSFDDDPKIKGFKQVAIRGMNDLKTLADRQIIVEALLADQIELIDFKRI